MKLDNPKAESIVITTEEEISISGQNIGKCKGCEIKIEETQLVNEKDIFLTRPLANSLVSSKLASFVDKNKAPEIETPTETLEVVKNPTKNKRNESGNQVDGQK